MKKFFTMIVLMLSMLSSVYAADVAVQINGEIIDFTDSNGAKVNAQIINDRTMVPFRKIFNKLGVTDENIEWQAATRTIIAKKDNVEIKLQIDNLTAEKKVNQMSQKIKLDSAPVIVNDRTLVPLRFIAESLGKTVGWDGANRTAIIIDCDYFLNVIKSKSPDLYNFIIKDSSNASISITRNYYDLEDSSRNDTAVISAQITENKINDVIKQNVNVSFSGTNELMKEIASEGWSNIKYENNYYKDYFTTTALNDGLKNVYGQSEMKFKYTALNCEGKYDDNIDDTIKLISNIDENAMSISTFASRKDELSALLSRFKSSGTNSFSTGNINSNDLEIKYFDFAKFDNILCNSSISRTYNFLNSQLFKYDLILETLCYDYPTINCKFTVNDSKLDIDFIGINEYNEKIEYLIKINK